jgi:putative oxidoreductase
MPLNLVETNPDWVLSLIRVTLGVIFFAHGAQKMLGWFVGPGVKETIRTMHEFLGLPVPVVTIATEFLGGTGLIVGLLSQLAAFGIAVTMVAAILMVHRHFGLFMNWLGDSKGHGIEFSSFGDCTGDGHNRSRLRCHVAGSPTVYLTHLTTEI